METIIIFNEEQSSHGGILGRRSLMKMMLMSPGPNSSQPREFLKRASSDVLEDFVF